MTQANPVTNPLGSFTQEWFPRVIADESELEQLVDVTGSEQAVSKMLHDLYFQEKVPADAARERVLQAIQTPRFVPL